MAPLEGTILLQAILPRAIMILLRMGLPLRVRHMATQTQPPMIALVNSTININHPPSQANQVLNITRQLPIHRTDSRHPRIRLNSSPRDTSSTHPMDNRAIIRPHHIILLHIRANNRVVMIRTVLRLPRWARIQVSKVVSTADSPPQVAIQVSLASVLRWTKVTATSNLNTARMATSNSTKVEPLLLRVGVHRRFIYREFGSDGDL